METKAGLFTGNDKKEYLVLADNTDYAIRVSDGSKHPLSEVAPKTKKTTNNIVAEWSPIEESEVIELAKLAQLKHLGEIEYSLDGSNEPLKYEYLLLIIDDEPRLIKILESFGGAIEYQISAGWTNTIAWLLREDSEFSTLLLDSEYLISAGQTKRGDNVYITYDSKYILNGYTAKEVNNFVESKSQRKQTLKDKLGL